MKQLLTSKQTNNPNNQQCSNAEGRGTWGKKRNLVRKIQLFQNK